MEDGNKVYEYVIDFSTALKSSGTKVVVLSTLDNKESAQFSIDEKGPFYIRSGKSLSDIKKIKSNLKPGEEILTKTFIQDLKQTNYQITIESDKPRLLLNGGSIEGKKAQKEEIKDDSSEKTQPMIRKRPQKIEEDLDLEKLKNKVKEFKNRMSIPILLRYAEIKSNSLEENKELTSKRQGIEKNFKLNLEEEEALSKNHIYEYYDPTYSQVQIEIGPKDAISLIPSENFKIEKIPELSIYYWKDTTMTEKSYKEFLELGDFYNKEKTLESQIISLRYYITCQKSSYFKTLPPEEKLIILKKIVGIYENFNSFIQKKNLEEQNKNKESLQEIFNQMKIVEEKKTEIDPSTKKDILKFLEFYNGSIKKYQKEKKNTFWSKRRCSKRNKGN